MKKIVLLILMAFIASLNVSASRLIGNGIYYNVLSETSLTVEVTYGKQFGEYFGVVNIPKKISYNGVYYTVIGIGDNAFSGCSGLTKVTFPETVTSIGNYAFSGCNAMLEIVIPTTVNSIGNYAFNGCSSLKSIKWDFTKTGLSLGYGCSKGSDYGLFYDCPLDSVVITRPFTGYPNQYSKSPFANHPTLKKVIYKNWINTHPYLFYGCKSLTTVVFPSFMKEINDFTFYGCTNLNNVTIPDEVTTIGNSSFGYCYGLTSFTLGSSVQSIGEHCFDNCITLKSFTFPGNLTKIGDYAFQKCSSLKYLKFEFGTAQLDIGHGSTKGSQYNLFYDCPLDSVTLRRGLRYSPNSDYGYSPFCNHPTLRAFAFYQLRNTGSYMLYGCTNLKNVTFNSSMQTINEFTFANCKALMKVTMPASVTKIEKYAFRDCDNITDFKIGSGVQEIGDYCFAGCFRLTGLIFPPALTSIGNYAFSGCTAFNNFAIEESDIALSLGYGTSAGEAYGLFNDCPLTSVFIGRDLNYTSSKAYGYSPLANINTLKEARFGNPVSKIPDYILWNAKNLETVAFNKSCKVKTVGACAFAGCNMLKSLTLPESVVDIMFGPFQSMPITSFKIGPAVETIGDYAFNNCNKLTGLIIPPSVKSIGNYAFKNCSAFNNLTFEEGVDILQLGNGTSESEDYGLFRDCPLASVFIGRPLSSSKPPFSNITTITEARFGNPVTKIPEYFFSNCSELKTVEFNKSCQLETIDVYAFDNCPKLATPEFPQTYTTIGEGAFRGCASFTELTIPGTATSIGNYAFNGCTGLKKLVIDDSSETLKLGYNTKSEVEGQDGKGLFRDCPLNTLYIGRNIEYNYYSNCGHSAFAFLSSLTTVSLGNSMTTVNNQMFRSCSGIKNIRIPYTVTSINKSAFINCSQLESVQLPSLLETLGDYTFYNCFSLADIKIPATVKTIGESAFKGCGSLDNMTVLAEKTPIAYDNTFSNYNIPLRVPASSLNAYKTTSPWNMFSTIEAIVPSVILGDANGDGKVTITDAVGIVNHILDNPSADFSSEAADTNGDEKITITDAVGVVNIILNQGSEKASPTRAAIVEEENTAEPE